MSVSSREDFIVEGRVKDISSIGARMEFSQQGSPHDSPRAEAFPPGASISVSIAPSGKAPIALEARIVWRQRQLFGVAFLEVPEEPRSRLWNLLVDTALKARGEGQGWLGPDSGSGEPQAGADNNRRHQN